uniref:Uncharacterized protein n=1 Tax=Timema genevievae TaxID=629358 RepID=A0A7R9JTI4_TIMGE|nr:unnamed protein product [Timema genevievae]
MASSVDFGSRTYLVVEDVLPNLRRESVPKRTRSTAVAFKLVQLSLSIVCTCLFSTGAYLERDVLRVGLAYATFGAYLVIPIATMAGFYMREDTPKLLVSGGKQMVEGVCYLHTQVDSSGLQPAGLLLVPGSGLPYCRLMVGAVPHVVLCPLGGLQPAGLLLVPGSGILYCRPMVGAVPHEVLCPQVGYNLLGSFLFLAVGSLTVDSWWELQGELDHRSRVADVSDIQHDSNMRLVSGMISISNGVFYFVDAIISAFLFC